jgi:carboxypeptidase C (cathepsin A)
MPSRTCLLALVVFLLSFAPARAQDKGPLKETLSETKHTLTVGGVKLEYTATAGNLLLKEESGKVKASVFFVAYIKTGVSDPVSRPITFAFNGGPGSSAVWLHLGAFGPKRVLLGASGEALPPPYRLVHNESTILDLTDLVFIDPVSTGYSRPAPGQDAKQFHGVKEDVQSVGDFIRLYVTRFNRWGSPKFLAGESYGTTRAAGLASYLQDRYGMDLNGIILISAVLNFQTIRFDDGNDLPYPLFLPSYTATAWYHKRLTAELQGQPLPKVLEEAEHFAENEYTLALLKGDKLTNGERQEIAARLARYTGLSTAFILRSNLRVTMARFGAELLRDQRRSVGRYDSRYKGIDLDAASSHPDFDPSYTAVQGAFTACLNEYLKRELKYQSELPYEILTGRVQPWSYKEAMNHYLNVSGSLRQAMTRNPSLRVFVACGYYDLATPYLASHYTIAHLGLARSLTGHVTLGHYEAGHMMYVNQASHRKLKRDLASFYHAALSESTASRGLTPPEKAEVGNKVPAGQR